jgi:hypothetical protein
MVSGSSDAELIASVENAADAFAVLYERHVDDVLRYFVQRTGCAQTAADLTAETFAAALVSRRRFSRYWCPGPGLAFQDCAAPISAVCPNRNRFWEGPSPGRDRAFDPCRG